MSLFSILDTLEYPIIQTLQNLDGTILDSFFMYMSNISLMVMTFGIIIAYMIWKKRNILKPFFLGLGISLGIGWMINVGFFKILLVFFGIFRPRPWIIHPDIMGIGQLFTNSSFPSSHMAFTTLFIVIVTYFEKKFLPFGIMIILIMGLSRVHNGMHYPSDVLIGTILGVIYGYSGLYLMKRFKFEKKHWWEKWFG